SAFTVSLILGASAGTGTPSQFARFLPSLTGANEAGYQFLRPGDAGQVWTLTLNGVQVSYTVLPGDTVANVTNGLLRQLLLHTTGYSPLVSGSTVTFKTGWIVDSN